MSLPKGQENNKCNDSNTTNNNRNHYHRCQTANHVCTRIKNVLKIPRCGGMGWLQAKRSHDVQ